MDTAEIKAYKQLKDLIIRGRLPADEFLSQRMLAGKVSGSVISVRGALRRLENDGLIESVPKWGFRIPAETEETLKDRYFMRELLETGAVKLIVEAHNPEHEKIMRDTAKACDSIRKINQKNIDLFAEKHFEFHMRLAHLSGSPMLAKALARINLKSMMLLNAKRGWARGSNASKTYHMDLTDALFSGRKRTAVKAITGHVRSGLAAELKVIQEHEGT